MLEPAGTLRNVSKVVQSTMVLSQFLVIARMQPAFVRVARLFVAYSLLVAPVLWPPSAFAEEHKIAAGTWFGCIDRAAVEKIATYRAQRDTEAAAKLLTAGVQAGRCTIFKVGNRCS
jgi:hypothetical protein